MGPGAVGGYYGAKLALAGHELVFVARGEGLAALRQNGLRVRTAGGELRIRDGLFTEDVGAAGHADLILLCVKSYDTESAAAALAPAVGRNTVILSLQNGVDNAAKIARLFGHERTAPAVVYVGAQVVAPAVVEHSSGGRLVLGSLGSTAIEAVAHMARVLDSAAIPCEISADVETALWRKLLWNAPFCAISTLTRSTVEEILRAKPLVELASECMEEVRAAAASIEIRLERRWLDEIFQFSASLGTFKPSMLQDFEARKPLEYDAFNGIVVRLLRHAGKTAPVNQSFFALLQQLDKEVRQEALLRHHG
jgi:2-dehydropantoate 2-reductase